MIYVVRIIVLVILIFFVSNIFFSYYSENAMSLILIVFSYTFLLL